MNSRLPMVLLVPCSAAFAQVQWVAAGGLNLLYARSGHAMAYDSARGRLVLFGGGAGSWLDDTWEWDGTTWTRGAPSVRPRARHGHAAAYDPLRRRTILFGGSAAGGFLFDTWEWDGSTWTQRFPPASPQARSGHAMAFDAARGRIVLAGGYYAYGVPFDTWEWDGTTWTQRAPATSPSQRSSHGLAYDAARQRIVLFGGAGGSTTFAETWEWDGTNWTQRAPPVSPPARSSFVFAYDAARARVLLFGGRGAAVLADTWEWDGNTWLQRTPPGGPSAREGGALAYDTARGRGILFGGSSASGLLSDTWEWDGAAWTRVHPGVTPGIGGDALCYDSARMRTVLFGSSAGENGTWEWDGSRWTERTPATRPPRRIGHALAYDAARGRAVLFGGQQGDHRGPTLGDTWEWDGTDWTQRNPAVSPSPRTSHAMAFDGARRRTVLFGGWSGGTGPVLSDTWEWDGAMWAQASPPAAPMARSRPALTFDAARSKVVLFGGYGGPPFGTMLADTWVWDGAAWAQRSPPVSPPARAEHALAFDAARGRVVLYGGRGASTLPVSDTWEWDGTSWLERFPPAPPPASVGHGLAFHAARGRTILYGVAFAPDTWEYFVPACDVVGAGHAGGGLNLSCSGPARPGLPFCVSFSDPPPRGTGSGLLLAAAGSLISPPLILDPPGVCATAFVHLLPQLVLPLHGEPLVFCVTLPGSPALVGLALTLQGAALETGACFRATDAIVMTIQP